MNVGVVGLGVMGKNHARICKSLGILSAVFDIDSSVAQSTGKELNVNWFSDLESFLDSQLDAAIVATPTSNHKQAALRCINSGLHVLVEKPLSLSLSEAADICQAADISKKILTVGYIERYNPSYVALKELVDGGEFGDITSINIKRVGGSPRSADNVIVDLMTHDFSLLLDMLKTYPENLYTNCHFNDNVLDSAQVMLKFKEISATCEANWVSPTKIRQIHLTGTNGYCEVDLIKQQLKMISRSASSLAQSKVSQNIVQSTTTMSFQKEPLKAEIEAFVDAIRTQDISQVVSGRDAVNILKLTLDAARAGE